MTRQEHLQFCKNCKLKSFDIQKGVTCSLTNEIANFDNECQHYVKDETIEKVKQSTTKSNNNFKFIIPIIIGSLLVLIFFFLLNKKKEVIDNKLVSNVSFYDSFNDEDCINFALKIETGIHNYEPQALDNSIDFRYIEKCISTKIDIAHEDRKYLLNLLKQKINLGEVSVASLELGGDFSFRTYYKKNEIPHIVFRTYYNQNIQYIDYQLGIKNDKIVIRDAFNYSLGENWSVTFAETALNNTDKSISQYELSNAINKYKRIEEMVKNNNHEEASELFYSIAPKFRRRTEFQLLEISIAAGFNTEKHIQLIDNKLKKHANEVRFTSFHNMLKFCSIGDVNQTKKYISQLNEYVNNDPILDFYIGMAYINNNQPDFAQEYFEKFIDNNPFVFDGYDILIMINLEQKDIKSAMENVNLVIENFNITKQELHEHLIGYDYLLNSKEYKSYFNKEA